MKSCDWCGKASDDVVDLKESAGGVEFDIQLCKSCLEHKVHGKCIECEGNVSTGQQLNCIGRCLQCAQLEMLNKFNAGVKQEESRNFEELQEYLPEKRMTDEEFADFLVFGQETFNPQYRKRIRKNWVRKILACNKYWSRSSIDKYFEDIDKAVDANFDGLNNRSLTLVPSVVLLGTPGVKSLGDFGDVSVVNFADFCK